jgi:hypothetical protein
MLGEIEEDLLDIMGVDTLGLKSARNEYGIENKTGRNSGPFGDRWCWFPVILIQPPMLTATC